MGSLVEVDGSDRFFTRASSIHPHVQLFLLEVKSNSSRG